MPKWYVLRLSNSPLAITTLKRLRVDYRYPVRRVRRPRQPDLIEPMLPGYALVTFDPDLPIILRFEGGIKYPIWWSQFNELPGIARIFHNGMKPLAIREEVQADLEEDMLENLNKHYESGATARVIDGTFASFLATIRAVDEDGNIRAAVSIFGREAEAIFAPKSLELVT